MRNRTTLYFERKETKFVGNKTAIYSRNRSSLCLLLVFLNSLVFVSFLRLSELSHRQEQGGSMPSTQAVAPRPGDSRDGSAKVRSFDKRTHRHKPFDRQRFVSGLWLRHAQLRDFVEVWALTGECSPPVRECSPPVRECSPPDWNWSIFFVQTFVDFALSLPGHSLWVCLHPGPWFFFSETTNRDKKWKLVPNVRLPR